MNRPAKITRSIQKSRTTNLTPLQADTDSPLKNRQEKPTKTKRKRVLIRSNTSSKLQTPAGNRVFLSPQTVPTARAEYSRLNTVHSPNSRRDLPLCKSRISFKAKTLRRIETIVAAEALSKPTPHRSEAAEEDHEVNCTPVDPLLQAETGCLIRWQAGEIIGQGSEAQVLTALNLATGEWFAVKRLYWPCSQQNIKKLSQEVAILVGLSHENIVQYRGSERINNNFCIYLEYMPGGSIKSVIDKNGPLSEEAAKPYIRQILQGLAYLHSQNVVHRDLKCANVLLDDHGKVKLCDFGCARALITQFESGSLRTIKGSVAWTAPEVLKQSGHGRKADVWSVGCTVLEMLTGQRPWHGHDDYISLLMKLANSSEVPDIPESLSEEARDFLVRCLQRDPAMRITVDQMLVHPFLIQLYS